MRRLHLLRHAKSSWADPTLADRDRPLNGRGRRAAIAIGHHCSTVGVGPQLVVCSPSVRTRQTLDLVLPGLADPEIVIEEGLYHASLERLRQVVAGLPGGVAEAMLVGHNPGLQDLAIDLALPGPRAGRVAEKLPTGALVTFAAAVESWGELADGEAEIVAYVTPGDLGVD